MVKKQKTVKKPTKSVKRTTIDDSFMGLTTAQTRSLAIGIVIVGLGLFILAGMTWSNKGTLQTSIFPTAAVTQAITPTLMAEQLAQATIPAKMISATSTAMLTEKKPLVKKLPNTSSKVTYTVEKDDTFAKIGLQLCGNEEAWTSIVKTNNVKYPHIIHPGETYTITCN